jgi:hypothetical protein
MRYLEFCDQKKEKSACHLHKIRYEELTTGILRSGSEREIDIWSIWMSSTTRNFTTHLTWAGGRIGDMSWVINHGCGGYQSAMLWVTVGCGKSATNGEKLQSAFGRERRKRCREVGLLFQCGMVEAHLQCTIQTLLYPFGEAVPSKDRSKMVGELLNIGAVLVRQCGI